MSDDHAIALHAHGSAAGRQQVVQKRASEAGRGKLHRLEFLRVRQPSHAIAHEYEAITVHDLAARRALREAEGVLDDLEDDVERGQREHTHYGPMVAFGDLKARIGPLEVSHQAAIQLGLPVPVVPDGRIELVDALRGHHGAQKADERAWAIDVDVEVRPAEPEYDGGVVRRWQRGVDANAAGSVG